MKCYCYINYDIKRVEDTEAAFFPSKVDEDNVMFNLQTNSTYESSWGFNYQGDYNDHNLKPISTQDLLAWAFQVARGMDYLSKRKVSQFSYGMFMNL